MKGSLQRQLLVSMVLLIAVPLLLIIIIGNLIYAAGIDEFANDFSVEMLSEVRTNIDITVGMVDQVIEYLSRDADVIDFLRLKDAYDENRIQAETQARHKARSFMEINEPLLGGILIAGENDLYVSNELYRVTRYPLNRERWYQSAVAADGERVLIARPIGRNIRSYRVLSPNDIVSVVRAVKDPESGEILGVICVDMLTRGIEDRIRSTRLGKSGYVFVRDDRGDIVYAPVNDTVYRIDAKTGASVQNISGERYQILLSHSDVTDWDTVGVFRMGETPEQVNALHRYTLIMALAAVALATLLSFRFSASFTRPIKRLALLMGEAERGNLDVTFQDDEATGEISTLGQSFNSMIAKIRELLSLVYRQQQEKRRAEIQTLQAQIKPHFLYNTLDTIRWMAEEHDAPEIVNTVSALTRLFRISLSRGREIIPLSEETEHVRSYLYIQKVRYEEKLNYTIDIPDELGTLKVQKLILQPLVENAIYHGIKQKRGPGHIEVVGRRLGDTLVLTVSDDGAGMSPERCAQLNRALTEESDAPDSGYGIFNVNNRIRLSYGKQYGLHYEINPAGGITVTLTCPVDGAFTLEQEQVIE